MQVLNPLVVERLKVLGNIPGLIQALDYGEEWAVRRAATQALQQVGDGRAVEALAAALEDEKREVRRAAARALGEIGDTRAYSALRAALNDPNGRVRRASCLQRASRPIE